MRHPAILERLVERVEHGRCSLVSYTTPFERGSVGENLAPSGQARLQSTLKTESDVVSLFRVALCGIAQVHH